MSLSECTVRSFLELLGSAASAPGGGSASALSGALGAALSEMVGALTVTRKKYAQYREETELCLEKCAALRTAFLAAVDHDTEVFSLFSTALKLPSETPEEKSVRTSAIQDALISCIESPLHVMELSYEAATLLRNMPGKTNVSAESDLGVASLMLGAAVQSAWLNILINLRSLKDKDRGAAYLDRGTDLLNRTLNVTNTIYEQLLDAYRAEQIPAASD